MREHPAAVAGPDGATGGFRHELYPYEGAGQFLEGAMAFIDDALAGNEQVLVSVAPPKERMLRAELTGAVAQASVTFLDGAAMNRNPGRLIPAWQAWIAKLAGQGHAVRGIGESPWGPSVEHAAELRYHEWLLNLAFARSPAWWLLCPYDRTVLEPAVLDAAGRCHPFVLNDGSHGPNSGYSQEPYTFEELSEPCDPHEVVRYTRGDLPAVRDKVGGCAAAHGIQGDRLCDLLVAATEVAANSIMHGGGHGTLRTWATDTAVICEFHDSGHIRDPLIGRVRPTIDQPGGRGLWLVHQLCDLVQIRSSAQTGTTIRLQTLKSEA